MESKNLKTVLIDANCMENNVDMSYYQDGMVQTQAYNNQLLYAYGYKLLNKLFTVLLIQENRMLGSLRKANYGSI